MLYAPLTDNKRRKFLARHQLHVHTTQKMGKEEENFPSHEQYESDLIKIRMRMKK